jgi:asparagine synthase (glutamine-hydrolysing)
MANALGQYGPDRSDLMVVGSVGLVRVLMRMTPEDQFDHQPWRGPSGAVICADVRLDNRDDILTRIGLARSDAITWADSRVLLTAWEKFGDEIWPALRGPFAVAIWDPHGRILRLVRDHLGLNVVMWHRAEQFFAFASMPKGLFALPEVPRELNEEKFADFLVLNHAEHATTVYRNIFRILPAHLALVQGGGSFAQHRYWCPDNVRAIRLPSDQAYAEGLQDVLDKAVRRQLRSAHPIGCYLSGGLDSSSVAALAARALGETNQRLSAFTQVPREGFCGPVPTDRYADETPYVEAIRQAIGNIDVTYVRNDECDDFADMERFFLAFEGPIRNPTNLGWMLGIQRRAKAQGRRVLLSGLYGNFTISWSGWSQSVDHLLRGRLLQVCRQLILFYHRSPYSRWTALQKLLLDPLLPNKAGNWIDHVRHPSCAGPWQSHAAIRPEFAISMGVAARAGRVGHDFLYRTRPGERSRSLTQIDYIGDWQAAQKAVTGVEERDPTADIDVVSYCFGIPPEQYLVEDIDRSLIRRAMWNILPEIVLTNRQSGLQSADWYEKLASRRDVLASEISGLGALPLARRMIDLDRLARALDHWPNEGWQTPKIIQEYHLALTRGLAGGRFLRWFESANR